MKIDILVSTLGSLIGGFLAIVLIVVAAINNKSHECKGKVVDNILKLKRKINSTTPDSVNLKEQLNNIREFCSKKKSCTNPPINSTCSVDFWLNQDQQSAIAVITWMEYI